MTRPLTLLPLVLLALGLSAPVSAARADGVTDGGPDGVAGPQAAAPGSWLPLPADLATVAGDARPRVWLRSAADGALMRARVRRVDGQLGFRVPRRAAGAHDLLLQPRPGGPEALVTAGAAVDVRAPELEAARWMTPGGAYGPTKEALEVTGRFLGPRRALVRVASRRARVVSWEPGEGPADSGRLVLRPSQRLGDGEHPVHVETGAGRGSLLAAVSLTDTGHGPEPFLRGEVQGGPMPGDAASGSQGVLASAGEVAPFVLEAGFRTVGHAPSDTPGRLLLQGRDGKTGRGWSLFASLRYDPATPGWSDLRGTNAEIQLVRGTPAGFEVWTSLYDAGGHARVHLTPDAEGRLAGTLDAHLVRVYGEGPPLDVSLAFQAPPTAP